VKKGVKRITDKKNVWQLKMKPDKLKLQRKQLLTAMVIQQGNILPKAAM